MSLSFLHGLDNLLETRNRIISEKIPFDIKGLGFQLVI